MPHEVIMPALGMTQDSGVIVTWRKALGDTVAIGDPLFDVETDKATMEVEAAHAGYLTEIRANAGADVPVGETIAIIAEAPGGARLDLAPEATKEPAPRPPAPPKPRDKAAAPSTLSVAPTASILASPKAKIEAHRRGIDLRRLADQGLPQPFHVADLERLKPETATSSIPTASLLTATFAWAAFDDFIAWAEKKTGTQKMRQATLAAFAASAFRAEVGSGAANGLAISVLSMQTGGSEVTLRDPDRHGLGDLDDAALKSGETRPDLTLIDLVGTRLVDYRPPVQPGRLSVVMTDNGSGEAYIDLHFCEEDLPLLAAARFLDNFATRAAEPILQLL